MFLYIKNFFMGEIFKGRSGSFIAYGDPLVLYTGGAQHKLTAVHGRLHGGLLSLTPAP